MASMGCTKTKNFRFSLFFNFSFFGEKWGTKNEKSIYLENIGIIHSEFILFFYLPLSNFDDFSKIVDDFTKWGFFYVFAKNGFKFFVFREKAICEKNGNKRKQWRKHELKVIR